MRQGRLSGQSLLSVDAKEQDNCRQQSANAFLIIYCVGFGIIFSVFVVIHFQICQWCNRVLKRHNPIVFVVADLMRWQVNEFACAWHVHLFRQGKVLHFWISGFQAIAPSVMLNSVGIALALNVADCFPSQIYCGMTFVCMRSVWRKGPNCYSTIIIVNMYVFEMYVSYFKSYNLFSVL